MPIRADLRHHYTGPAWEAARARILERAGNACEDCRKPNRAIIETHTCKAIVERRILPVMFWRPYGTGSAWRDWRGQPAAAPDGRTRIILVQIHVAHLNHLAGDDRDDNMRALCAWCHFHYDAHHHHETRGRRKDGARPLLQEAS